MMDDDAKRSDKKDKGVVFEHCTCLLTVKVK